MTPETHAWTTADATAHLRRPTASDDKYSRGVVGVRTGSDRYPGAAVLGVEAAHRTGAGMVRYIGPARAEDLVLARRPETVTGAGRVQAWLVGSGTDAAARILTETEALRALFAGNRERFEVFTRTWPADVRDHARLLTAGSFVDGAARERKD